MRITEIFLVLTVLLTAQCLSISENDIYDNVKGKDEWKNQITWWVFGDSHVGHRYYDGQLVNAVNDVKTLEISDYAICLGDCIDERVTRPDWPGNLPKDEWKRFCLIMNELPHDWTYVLGNHDNDGREVPVKPVTEPNYFSKIVNGVRIITISDEHLDEEYNRNLEMSQEQIDWFKGELTKNPEVPTIIMSHQDVFGLAREGGSYLAVYHEWLEPNISEFNIVLWVSAHAHDWYLEENAGGHGFSVLIVNDILYDEQSSFMTIEDKGNTSKVTFRFRDHRKGEWISVKGYDEYTIEVSLNGITPVSSFPDNFMNPIKEHVNQVVDWINNKKTVPAP